MQTRRHGTLKHKNLRGPADLSSKMFSVQEIGERPRHAGHNGMDGRELGGVQEELAIGGAGR